MVINLTGQVEGFTDLFNFFDILWVILAVNIAWKVTAFSKVPETINLEITKTLEAANAKLSDTK